MTRRKRDRSELIKESIENKNSEYVPTTRVGFLQDTEVLSELGVTVYRANAEEDGSSKQHELHIIPADERDSDRYALEIYAHYGVGVDNAAVLCPKFMKGVFQKYGIDVPKDDSGIPTINFEISPLYALTEQEFHSKFKNNSISDGEVIE